jgi:hypothetical protein
LETNLIKNKDNKFHKLVAMKATKVLALLLGGVQLALSWDVDPRCPPPPAPAKRALGEDAQDR